MCGIAGAFSSWPVDDDVRAMTRTLEHRGPDDAGFAAILGRQGEYCGAFGHRRLSILDLSTAGHQPMVTGDGRFSIVFNGEIYNYKQLRAALEAQGERFRSGTDTEVLLLGWARYGAEFLHRLRGMFAFAIWDADRGVATLVRDPFGIKPLYLTEADGALLFASEVRAILSTGRVPRIMSPQAARDYLTTGSVCEPLTIIEGIRSLPAGCTQEVRVRGGRLISGPPLPYRASPIKPVPSAVRNSRDGAGLVREALRDSVAHHLVSDVPVGFFLSGGIDSSAVVGVASEVADVELNTFTVTFAEEEFSESVPARALARRFKTRHREIKLSGDDLIDALPPVFAAMDQPSTDGLNTFVVSRAVRESGIKVVLSGLGGDELFAGYPSFRRAHGIQALWRMAHPLRRWGLVPDRWVRDLRSQKLHLALAGKTPAQGGYLASRMVFSDAQGSGLIGFGGRRPLAEASAALSVLQQVSWYELTGYMRNTLLRDSDTFSMIHGLELRVPFVDEVVAHAAMSVHDSVKLRRGSSKPLLVAAIEDLVPREIWDRPKQGFTLPFDTWMRRELRSEVQSMFDPGVLESVGLDTATVGSVWGDFLSRRAGMNWSRPWALYTLVRWARANGVALGDRVAAGAVGAMGAMATQPE